MNAAKFNADGELWEMLKSFRQAFILVFFFSLVANALMLAPTAYMLQIYDRVLVGRNELTLLVVSLGALVLFSIASFADWSRARLMVAVSSYLDSVLSSRVFGASFASARDPSSSNPQRAISDLTEVRQFLTGLGVYTFFDAPWSLIYLLVLFLLHPILGYAAIGFALVQGLLVWFGHHRAVKPTLALGSALASSNAFVNNHLRLTDVVESMGMLNNLRQRWQLLHQAYMTQHAATLGLTHRIGAWSKFVRYSQQSLALGVGALLVVDGQLSLGGMIAANILISRALTPIDQLVSTWRSWIGAHAAYGRLSALLKEYPAHTSLQRGEVQGGELQLSSIAAWARGRVHPILKDVDMKLSQGTIAVITGPSGSGKSTLARVIMGVWPNVQGEVSLNGQSLSSWSREELGPHLGYLPQDVELLNGTIAENIARFAAVDSGKVVAAAKNASVHEMILKFPKGYDTPVGASGGVLSGGQLQRIGLARAIYGNPKLVVLDEPNANLDEAGELALVRVASLLKAKGSTVVLITHRPGLLAVADQVFVLNDGHLEIAELTQSKHTPALPT